MKSYYVLSKLNGICPAFHHELTFKYYEKTEVVEVQSVTVLVLSLEGAGVPLI